jgi:hypothetical protein
MGRGFCSSFGLLSNPTDRKAVFMIGFFSLYVLILTHSLGRRADFISLPDHADWKASKNIRILLTMSVFPISFLLLMIIEG